MKRNRDKIFIRTANYFLLSLKKKKLLKFKKILKVKIFPALVLKKLMIMSGCFEKNMFKKTRLTDLKTKSK